MRPELIVAGKEFRDHLASKRFLAIFAILMLLAVIGMATGMDQYNKSLDQYKKSQAEMQQQQWFKDQVAGLQQQIADGRASGMSGDELQSLQAQLDNLLSPTMPSVLQVFGGFIDSSTFQGGYFALVMMFLAIALGFDLITRDKEEGSLRSLLSHPVYRDAVINGKILGSMAVLVVVLGSMFLVTLAIMLFFGQVPTADDLLRIVAFFILALLYCGVFFVVATLFSAVAKTSAMSMLCVLGVIILLLIVPYFAPKVSGAIMGAPPTPPETSGGGIIMPMERAYAEDANVSTMGPMKPYMPEQDEAWQKYYNDSARYYQSEAMITDAFNMFSPLYDFGSKISPPLIYKYGGDQGGPIVYANAKIASVGGYYVDRVPTVWDSLAFIWNSILALAVELVLALCLSYVAFMRMDIR